MAAKDKNRCFGTEPAEAKRSAQKLLAEDFEAVVMSHGPVPRADARARVQETVERCWYWER